VIGGRKVWAVKKTYKSVWRQQQIISVTSQFYSFAFLIFKCSSPLSLLLYFLTWTTRSKRHDPAGQVHAVAELKKALAVKEEKHSETWNTASAFPTHQRSSTRVK